MPLFDTDSKYKFFSLGSGSSGNCYYLGNADHGILIDAGVGIRRVTKTLREYGESMHKIRGVLVTHDHADHIKTAGCLGVKHNLPIYATQGVHYGINRSRYTQGELNGSRRIIKQDETFEIESFKITAFDVLHDSIENVGYHIQFEDQHFVLATDVGQITPKIREYAEKANHLVIEANYDDYMLANGPYPTHLKQRICNGMGHLSNHVSATFLQSIYSERLKNVWLCHLSQDNNKPEVAYEAVATALTGAGAKIGDNMSLQTLSRYKASGLKEL